MQYVVFPAPATQQQPTPQLSLRQHFGYYDLPQLHVNIIHCGLDAWPTLPDPNLMLNLATSTGIVLLARQMFASAPSGGFTLGRVTYQQVASGQLPALVPNSPGVVQDITMDWAGPESTSGVDRFDFFVFPAWGLAGVGLSPPNTCLDAFNMLPAFDFQDGSGLNVFFFLRCPVMALVQSNVGAQARTFAHEMGHFIAWLTHGSGGLMARSSTSASTALNASQADDFIDSCWMNDAC